MQTSHKKTHRLLTVRHKCSRPHYRVINGSSIVAQELFRVHTYSVFECFHVYTSVKMTFCQKHPSLASVSFFFSQRNFHKHLMIVSRARLFWILLSACLMPDVISEYISADLQNCWQKHIEFSQLLANVREWTSTSFGRVNPQFQRISWFLSELLYTQRYQDGCSGFFFSFFFFK